MIETEAGWGAASCRRSILKYPKLMLSRPSMEVLDKTEISMKERQLQKSPRSRETG